MTSKLTKKNYYLDIALAVARRATCLKKHYGAIIVNNDKICATGYNGPPAKEPHCTVCSKISGNGDIEEYTACRSVHAEMNCLLQASKEEMLGADLYLAGFDVRTNQECNAEPCEICLRLIKNSGISRIFNRAGELYHRDADGILRRTYE